MRLVRLGLWGIILVLFMLLASIPVVWATPEQHALNQSTIPTGTPPSTTKATEVVPPGTLTATPIPLLPPSGSTQGHGFFILTGILLVGSALVLLLNVRRMERQAARD